MLGSGGRKRSGGAERAARHVTEECERLFCKALGAAFLVEKSAGFEGKLVMDACDTSVPLHLRQRMYGGSNKGLRMQQPQDTVLKHDLPTPEQSPDGRFCSPVVGAMGGQAKAWVKDYVEVWDYACGGRFRGFVAEKDDGLKTLFVFFDREVIGKDLKPGLMALLELAGTHGIDCSQLVVCVDRTAEAADADDLTRDLGWVGFELMMLDRWTGREGVTSDRWIVLGMDV